MERLNHQEPLSHVPMQATLTPATTSQRRLRRSVFQAIALPLLSLGVLSSCSDQAIKPTSVEPTGAAMSALSNCATGTMLTDLTGTAITDTLPTTYAARRTTDAVGVNHWSGEGFGLVDLPGPTTVTSTFTGNMPVRRFPGGLGGTWDWNASTHKTELQNFVATAKAEGVTRLFFVVNTNGVFHLTQDGLKSDSVVPGSVGTAYTTYNCITSYNFANCKAAMALHAKLFADQVVSEIKKTTNWGTTTTSWPEIVFEIGNEYPLLERHPNMACGTTDPNCTNGTYDNYAQVLYAYRTQMNQTATANGIAFKYAVAGLFPEHNGSSIWDSVKNYAYDYRVIHDYGWAPEVNGQSYDGISNAWQTDCQTMVSNGTNNVDGPTVYGLAQSTSIGANPKPVVITEFGTPDAHCGACGTTCPQGGDPLKPVTYTEAVLNDALLATKRMNLPDSNILNVNLKWPAKSRLATQNARSWQQDGSSVSTLLPVYDLHLMMGNFLNAQPVGSPTSLATGLQRATAAHATRRFAVYTNLRSTSYKVTATIATTNGTYSPSLAGIQGRYPHTDTALLTTTPQCNQALSGTTLTFGIAANSVVVVTY